MKKLFILIVSVFCYISFSKAQMVGSEQLVDVQVYQGTFIVNGDYNTYYPIVFKYGNQDRINHLRIYRRYSEPGPDALSPTHRGGLSLEIDVNYGGWGGSSYDWRVMDLRQKYHTTFAGAKFAMHYKGFVVWLRGGGFQYHYESEKPANIQVALNQEIIYNHSNNNYDAYAPPPKTEIDWETINAHKNDHWDYIKEKDFTGIDGVWQENGSCLYTMNKVGINTDDPGVYTLAVNGVIGAKEVKVTVDDWADFVFEPDYNLMSLTELQTFIETNKHFPEIPTSKEVKEEGVSVGEMNAKLVQKIEELTLYTLQQQELIENQNNKINNQEAIIIDLLKRIEKLENK